ncbi:hypothetical protein K438DRAFT_1777926 [Mycena galopus ATCC 62051]|nr:hypothetical protein K438DRAFT_1777926 [Mycena galopus ATCC 62051]
MRLLFMIQSAICAERSAVDGSSGNFYLHPYPASSSRARRRASSEKVSCNVLEQPLSACFVDFVEAAMGEDEGAEVGEVGKDDQQMEVTIFNPDLDRVLTQVPTQN